MTAARDFLKIILTATLGLLLVNCGGDPTMSEKVDVKTVPKKPMVFTSPVFVNGERLEPPWYRFEARFENSADASVTVIAMAVTTSIMDSNGFLKTLESAFDSSMLNYETDTTTCTYNDFGTIGAGVSGRLLAVPTTPTGCQTLTPLFYISGIPKDESIKHFRYRVKIRPLGWFNDTDGEPSDRFDKFIYVYTE